MAMCDFDGGTLRCKRCGWEAKRLPTFRKCRTIIESARDHAEEHATKRIRLPRVKPGSLVKAALGKIGVTPRLVSSVLGKPCGCQKRASAMDRAAEKATGVVEAALNWAANAAFPHPVSEEEVAKIATLIADGRNANRGLIEAEAKRQAGGDAG